MSLHREYEKLRPYYWALVLVLLCVYFVQIMRANHSVEAAHSFTLPNPEPTLASPKKDSRTGRQSTPLQETVSIHWPSVIVRGVDHQQTLTDHPGDRQSQIRLVQTHERSLVGKVSHPKHSVQAVHSFDLLNPKPTLASPKKDSRTGRQSTPLQETVSIHRPSAIVGGVNHQQTLTNHTSDRQSQIRLVQAHEQSLVGKVSHPTQSGYVQPSLLAYDIHEDDRVDAGKPQSQSVTENVTSSRSYESTPEEIELNFQSLEAAERSLLSLPRINFDELLPSLSTILDAENYHGTRPLWLQEASRAALASNFDLKLEAINPQVENAALLDALAEFEPTLNFEANRSSADQASLATTPSALPGQGEVQVDTTLSIDVPNRVGGLLQFTNESMFQEIVDEVQNNTPVIRYTQSILRGSGKQANLALIRAANLSTAAAIRDVEFTAIETVRDVETAYWQLHFEHQNLRAIAWTTEAAYNNLKLVGELGKARQVGVSDYLRTYSTYQTFRQQFESAVESTRLAERNLKNLVLIPDAPVSSLIRFELISVNVNANLLNNPPQINRAELVSMAIAKRPDFEAANLSIDAVNQQLIRARNDRLPQLDMFVEGSFASQRTNEMFNPASNDQDINQFNFGIETTLPLKGNRQAKSAIQVLLAERRTNLILRDQLSVTIAREVNDAVDQLEFSFKRLQSNDKAAQTAVRLYQQEFELLQKQTGPLNAESLFQVTISANQAMSDLFQARADYRVAETNLMTAVGALLESRNLIWCNSSCF